MIFIALFELLWTQSAYLPLVNDALTLRTKTNNPSTRYTGNLNKKKNHTTNGNIPGLKMDGKKSDLHINYILNKKMFSTDLFSHMCVLQQEKVRK